MTFPQTVARYRFGLFEADTATGELRRRGTRVRLPAQPFQVLCLLLQKPGEMVTREEISAVLWPDGTFVDYEHGVNSAINRLRDALGDKANSPRFIETLARRGYRFLAPVERIEAAEPGPLTAGKPLPGPMSVESLAGSTENEVEVESFITSRMLARPEDLPKTSHAAVQTLFLLLQVMYLGFYVGALANLTEINDLVSPLGYATAVFAVTAITAGVLIPARIYLICAAVFYAPRMRENFLKLWTVLLPLDLLWALSPFLLLHHINGGLALACVAPLAYSPFAQRSLILMGAGRRP